jgi:hypothetical protein
MATNCIVLFVQNLIHEGSIASKLSDVKPAQSAAYLIDRIVSGPFPSVEGLKTKKVFDAEIGRWRHRITAGKATWPGQDIEACQDAIDTYTLASFKRESQHEVAEEEAGLWEREWIDRFRITAELLPPLDRIVVGVDPPGTTGQCGIVVKGRGKVRKLDHCYTLDDCSTEFGASPAEWAKEVIRAYNDWEADTIVVETNFGGAMVKQVIRSTKGGENLRIIEVHASRGKVIRAEPCAALAEEGREHAVGDAFEELEKEKCRYQAGQESPNRMDADVWATTELMITRSKAAPPPKKSRNARY